MPEQYLHGVELIESDTGTRPIKTVKSSVIGLIGTAPEADPTLFPINQPTLIAGSRKEAAKLGTTGTLPEAIDGIFDQAGAMVVIIRIEEGTTDAETITNIIGGTNPTTGDYEGLQSFLSVESKLGIIPRLLIAPTFTDDSAVLTDFIPVAERLKAIIIADGPNTTDAAAIAYKTQFGSDRVFLIDPAVKTLKDGNEVIQPASPRVAGLIAKTDNDKGFWHSPSNKPINGITGISRDIDFSLGDTNSRANYLNENNITTIIQKDGYRLWGNRTLSSDPKWTFLSVRRTADMINDSLQKAHLWAIDKNITKTYIEDVTEGVNNYLRHLKSIGAIINGKCWADPELNTPDQIQQGKIYFDFDFTPPYPAEHITFTSHLVDDYLKEIL